MIVPGCDVKPIVSAQMKCGGEWFKFYNGDVFLGIPNVDDFQHIFDKLQRAEISVFYGSDSLIYIPVSWMVANCPKEDRSAYKEMESIMRAKFMLTFPCG